MTPSSTIRRALAVYRAVLQLATTVALAVCGAVAGLVGIEHIATDLGRHQLVGAALLTAGLCALETAVRRADAHVHRRARREHMRAVMQPLVATGAVEPVEVRGRTVYRLPEGLVEPVPEGEVQP
jgi:hypothetical protein